MIFNHRDTETQRKAKKIFLKTLFLFSVPLCSMWLVTLVSSVVYAESAGIPSLLMSLQVEGDPFNVWFEKGKTLYRLKAYSEAAEAFSRIGKDAPPDILEESLYLRANSLMKAGNYPEALSAVNLIPAKSRFYVQGLYTRAMISLNSGRERGAAETLEQVSKNLQSEDLALKAHLTLGFIHLDGNNPLEALKHFSVIPKDGPFYMQALFGSGWAYTKMGRWVRAVVFWEELAGLYPESSYAREALPHIGSAYATLSAYGKALEQNGTALHHYERMLEKISELEKEVRGKEIGGIERAIDFIGDRRLSGEFELYTGLLSLEEYLTGVREGEAHDVKTLIKASKEKRDEIIDRLSGRLLQGLEVLRGRLLDASVDATLEIARNLRLEGGGQISSDMIFDGP